jgi:POT family proton-dependent oligopeptide transporter
MAAAPRSAAGWEYARLADARGAALDDDDDAAAPRDSDGDVLQLQHGDDSGAPTDEDRASLRRVADALPWSAFLVALVEMCERFTYYGLSGPFQNYISNRYDDPANPGALGE